MQNFKKNIILSSVNEKLKDVRGIFTIEKNSDTCTGILRIYNLTNLTNNYCLGILVNGVPLQKTALGNEVVFCKIELPLSIELTSKIAIVVVQNNGTTYTPLIFGSTQNSGWNENYNIFNADTINNTIEEEIKKQIPNIASEISTPNTINLTPSKENSNDYSCANCVYKQSFYDNAPIEKEIIKENSEPNFFDIISPKLEELFELNPPCEELNNLVESSKWVTINVDDFQKYYIGVLYSNSMPKYIAYAVRGIYSSVPPKELEPDSQWLPLDSTNPTKEGFWIMYQDAKTGE